MSEATARIRLATPGDARPIAQIYAPIVRDTVISFEAEAPDAAEMERRISGTLERFPWLVMARDGAIDGYAYASRHRERVGYQWSVDVSCYVHERARGRGVGKALYRRLLAVLRRQGLRNAFAGIALPNAASVALHESVGFVKIGHYRQVGFKHGAWWDTGWWQCRLGDPDANPAPPVPLPLLGPGILDEA